MKKYIFIIFSIAFISLHGQESTNAWWNPVQHDFAVIEGQAWTGETQSPYDRLPARAKSTVRNTVWNLSKQSAGLMIRFRTNANEIIVRYGTKKTDPENPTVKTFALNHMPATGVSGVDLYAIDSEGRQVWCAAKRQFSDTITYRYQGLDPLDDYHNLGPEYRLYLPLYNQVNWLEIGVDRSAHFDALPVRKEKPIVVYGTSITQGACASRPGMAWTSILSRKMDRPLINLGFSGNGRLEQEVLDLLPEIDAKLYVLDCLPNLTRKTISDEELKKLVTNAVHHLKQNKPDTPILLVEHAGYTDGLTNSVRQEAFERVNRLQQDAFYQLKIEGVQDLYYLSNESIGLQLDDMVDGTHPTDLGMLHYAESYEKKLRSILNEQVGNASTTKPVTQYREPLNYDWEKRHREILDLNTTNPPESIIIANSIIQFWGGKPSSPIARESESWHKVFTPMGLRNYAYGWDRIENVLWRVHHGELDGFDAKQILLMIGTNNLHLNTNEEIIEGLKYLLTAIKNRQAKADITLMGILPRRDYEQRIKKLNLTISRLAGELNVPYADIGPIFLNNDYTVNETMFSDGLHPNATGYRKMRDALKALLK